MLGSCINRGVYPNKLKASFILLIFAAMCSAQSQGDKPIELALDIRDAPRKILHAQLVIPVNLER